ncbi:MAG TPA: LacI family DNA-binding transcriptional regulator [Symbiobacteriaceae bacterium]
MTTIRDVARLAGVAPSTASMALNDHPRISTETKMKVLAAARELNYQPNAMARGLKSRRTESVGLILTDIAGPFYSELIKGVEDVAIERGYQLVISSAHSGREESARRLLAERRTDGLIVLAPNLKDADLAAVASPEFPLVLLDRHLCAPGISCIRVDNVAAASEAVSHLINLGYRSILYVSGPQLSTDNQERLLGFRQALERAGLPFSPDLVVPGDFTEEGGRRAARWILDRPTLPDAVFAANDEMAIGVMEVFLDRGIRIPEDVALVGFDDIRLAAYVRPALTTVRQFKYELGQRAATLLFAMLDGTSEARAERISTELVIRESCGYRLRHKTAPI